MIKYLECFSLSINPNQQSKVLTLEDGILSCDQSIEVLLEPMEIGDLTLQFLCRKHLEMDPLIYLKTSMNLLGNPDLGYLEIF